MELHFTRTNKAADTAIDNLMDLVGNIRRPEIVREMILAALKAGQEDDRKADLKLMNTTLKEMRYTAKVFGPYRQTKKVTVFGSARTKPDDPYYKLAQQLGHKLAENGYMVITGGGPGIMQAANEGAGTDHSFGVNIRLPFEQKSNPIIEGDSRNIIYKYFFNRKVAFIKEADAIALFPGGFGTLDEGMEILTLVQTGKRNPIPLILIEEPGGTYWSNWVTFLKENLADRGYINQTDFKLFEKVNSVTDAVNAISHFYRRYHSLRFVKNKLVIRLTTGLGPQKLENLRIRFKHILEPEGAILRSDALPEEKDEPEICHLPRLILDFNKKDFAGLRALIEAINSDP